MKKNNLSNEEIAQICRGLSVLLHAGISQGDGLLLMAEEEQGNLNVLLLDLGKMMDEGMSFSQALEMRGCFPVYASGLIKVGEYTGHLEEAFNALEEYYEGQSRLERQMKNVLTYPVLLMLLMLVVIGVLMIKVLPIFEEVYDSLGVTITGFARGLFFTGEVLGAFLPVLCAVLLFASVGVLLFVENQSFRNGILLWYRRKFGHRGIVKKMNNAHFAQALTMGLKSGMVLEKAVELAAEILKDVPEISDQCKHCVESLKAGETFGNALKGTGILPASACRMLEIGMRGGNGDHVMEGIAERLLEEAESEVTELISKVEPVMVTVISLLVGIILLSVMMPLINIMSAIG